MFEDIKRAFSELRHGNLPPGERRAVIAQMRDTLVHARLSLDDLRGGLATTRRRLEAERMELETVRRRKGLASGIGDQETVTVAERFEAQHLERLVVLEKKEAAQSAELSMVEREVEEMTQQLKAAAAGAGGAAAAASGATLEPDESASLDAELGMMNRSQRRAAADAQAEERLAELKRRMGK